MSKQRFRLEQVLAHKKRLEETMQIHLANLELRLRQETEALAALERRAAEQQQALRRRQGGARLDPGDVERALAYLDALDRERQRQGQAVAQIQEQVDRSREQLIAVAQERKALERLKEQQLERWALEEKRAELRATDEMNMARAHRRTA
ncbi:MAG TPA: flagellar export protein FliJ [Dehalococcoidia bacterium]